MPSYIKSLKSNLGDLIIPRTTATAVTYDNSTSGLESINTQDAIDEMMGKGWISSDDSIPSDPAAINADSLGRLPAADYATNESVDNKISSLDADSVNSANKDLSNLSDCQKALHNIGGSPNQDLFLNSFFIGGGSQLGNGAFPINQQMKTSYTSNNSVSIDRWIINNSTLTIKQDGVEVFGSDIYGNFTQYLENFRYFAGKTVTLSALITGGTGIGNGAYLDILDGVTEHTFNINETGIIFVTATLPDNITKLQAGVVTSNISGKTLNVAAMKLECGDKQTLGYKDDSGNWKLFEIPDYSEDLAKCQRYGLFSGDGMLESVPLTGGYAMMPTPVTLRAKPVIVGNVVVYDMNTNQPIPDTTVSVHSVMGNGVLLQVSGTNGLVYVYFPNGSGLLAEL